MISIQFNDLFIENSFFCCTNLWYFKDHEQCTVVSIGTLCYILNMNRKIMYIIIMYIYLYVWLSVRSLISSLGQLLAMND